MSTWTRFEGRLDDAEMRAVDAERTRDRVAIWRSLMIAAGVLLGLVACWYFLLALVGGGFGALIWALVLIVLAALALVSTLGPTQHRARAAKGFWITLLVVIGLMMVMTLVQVFVPAADDINAVCEGIIDERERRECESKFRKARVPILLASLALVLLVCCVPCLICGWSYHRQLHRLELILASPPSVSTELNYVNQPPPPEAVMYIDGIPATGSLSSPYPGVLPMPMPVPMPMPMPMGGMPMGAPLDLQTSAMMAASSPPMAHMGGPYPVGEPAAGMTPMPVPVPLPVPTPMSPPPLAGVATNSGSYYSDVPQ